MSGTFTVLSVIMPAFYTQNKVLLMLKVVTANPINSTNTQLAQCLNILETKRYFISPTSIHFTFSPNCQYFHCFHPIASEVSICKHINIPWVCFWHAIEQLMLLLPRPTHNYWTLFYLVYFYQTLKDDKFLQAVWSAVSSPFLA